jgi:hypothetical protein
VQVSLCVFLSFGSEGCVLVPRTSSNPVATWSWSTLVVELETCVGSRVHLVGPLSPSRRIFISSHSLPPLSSLPFRSFKALTFCFA